MYRDVTNCPSFTSRDTESLNGSFIVLYASNGQDPTGFFFVGVGSCSRHGPHILRLRSGHTKLRSDKLCGWCQEDSLKQDKLPLMYQHSILVTNTQKQLQKNSGARVLL